MSGKITTKGYIVEGGNSNQFLKADGSLDETTYATESQLDDINDALNNRYLKSETDDLLATKLDTVDYNQHFKGVYLTEAALIAAHPTAEAGDSAQVNEVGSTVVVNYSWDDELEEWVNNGSGGSGATNTDALPEGSSNLYFTTVRVLATVLSGISFVTGGEIVSTDSVLVAFGKLQKQISDALTAIGLKANINSPTFTGIPTAPTATAGSNDNTIANTFFVQSSTASVADAIYGSDTILSSGQSPYTLQLSDANDRLTTDISFNQNFSITVPANASVPFQIGTKIRINCGLTQPGYTLLSFAPGVTATGIASGVYLIRQKSSFELTKVGTDTWYVDELSLWSTNGDGNIVQNTDKYIQGTFIGGFTGTLGYSKFPVYTVDTLPTTSPNAEQGNWAYVTDAQTPTYLGTLTGGGDVVCPVFHNGTTWVSH